MKDQKWIERLISHEGREKIRAAIERTEKRTSAEIVPVIVKSSMTAGHVPWVLFLLLLLIAWATIPIFAAQAPNWVLDVGTFAFAFILTGLLERLDSVRRLLTPKHDQILSVERRAILEFHLAHVEATASRTGLLVFVSALERRAVVLADSTIVSRLPQETWRSAVDLLLDKAKAGDFAAGMCAAIDALGDRLEKEFPAHTNKQNQLDDSLIIKI